MERGSIRRRVLVAVALSVAALAAYLLLWPVPIDPAPWQPPAGRSRPPPNDALAKIEWYGRASLVGAEAIAFDARGRLHTGLLDGRVVRVDTDGETRIETVASTGGRPLGMKFDRDGRLIVADAFRGLLAIDPAGAVEVLATEHGGLPFRFTDDLDIAPDGTIYFSDASHKFDLHHYELDILEHGPNGRLLAYHPETKQTELVLDGLHFANGVAVGGGGAFVLVCETASYRVVRVELRGPERGRSTVFVDDLPGFPDNLTAAGGGERFWLALASPRDGVVDSMASRPWMRRLAARLPKALQPRVKRHAWVLGLDASGRIVHDLQHVSPDAFAPLTSAIEGPAPATPAGKQTDATTRRRLWFGSFMRDGIASLPAP